MIRWAEYLVQTGKSMEVTVEGGETEIGYLFSCILTN